MFRLLLISLLSISLLGCATIHSYRVRAEYQYGKHLFEKGYYKRAMRDLLPLACDGSPEAQYAVGYMYYYGLGVAQDTEVGYFWIERSASHRYIPAVKALELISRERDHEFKKRDKLFQ